VIVDRVEHRDRAPVVRVFLAVGRDSGVDVDTLTDFAQAWEQELGVVIEVGDELIDLKAGDAMVVDSGLASSLRPSIYGRTLIVDFDGSKALLDADSNGPGRIAGRGLQGYRWAIRHLVAQGAWPVDTYRYGEEHDHRADLRLPETGGPHPLVVLVHGGGWKHRWTRDLMAPIAVDLAKHGCATWNVEYRRVGGGGGWPTTFDDLRMAINALTQIEEAGLFDLDRVCFLGHSSGGQLALWAASDTETLVRPSQVVAIAPITDLVEASRRQLIGGENIAAGLLGGTHEEVPERYAAVSPRANLPLGVDLLLVQGLNDYIPDLVDLNRSYAIAARAAGDEVEHAELPDADHLSPIEPASAAWRLIRDKLITAPALNSRHRRARVTVN
jgi:acetyl esterase/lipase